MKIYSILFQLGIVLTAISQNTIQIELAHDNAIQLDSASKNGILINNIGDRGIDIDGTGKDGIQIYNTGYQGIDIYNTGFDGISIERTGFNGIDIYDTGDNGIDIESTDNDGIYINNCGGNGIYIDDANSNGLYIDDADDNGIYVYDATNWSMNIQGNKNDLSESPSSHIAQIINRNDGNNPDVLALKVGTAIPNTGVNFITFFQANNTGVGRIEGNGSGGVSYGTTGADYAESLLRLNESEDIEAGDIVGIYGGEISRHTIGATNVMVITDQAAVLGNQKEEESELHENVSFIGQVSVKVKGVVKVGDWIVTSGLQDGTGKAVSGDEITQDHRIVGRAWENNNDPGIKRVNTVVGLDHSEAKDAIIKRMDRQINDLQSQIDELKGIILKTFN